MARKVEYVCQTCNNKVVYSRRKRAWVHDSLLVDCDRIKPLKKTIVQLTVNGIDLGEVKGVRMIGPMADLAAMERRMMQQIFATGGIVFDKRTVRKPKKSVSQIDRLMQQGMCYDLARAELVKRELSHVLASENPNWVYAEALKVELERWEKRHEAHSRPRRNPFSFMFGEDD